MRIIHDSKYIEIPNKDLTWYHVSECPQLTCYVKDRNLYHRKATNQDHYFLVEQMHRHNYFDFQLFDTIHDCCVPDITQLMSGEQIIACLKRGIVFAKSLGKSHTDFITRDNLSALSIIDSNLDDDDIVEFDKLTSLIISNTSISLSFVDADHPLTRSLQELHMQETKVKSKTLRRFQCLKTLTVGQRSILKFLTEDHPLCETITDLEIFTFDVRGPESNLKNLQVLYVTDSINLKRNRMSSVPHFLSTLTGLFADGTNIEDDDLCGLTALRILYVSNCCNFTLKFLTEDHPLCETLEEISAAFTDMRGDGLQYLRRLRVLDAESASKFTMECITELSPICDTLEELKVSNTKMTDDGLIYLRKLTSLVMYDTKNITLERLDPNRSFAQTLQNLNASSSKLTDLGLQHMQKIRHLNIGETKIIKLSFMTENHPLCETLEILNAKNSRIDGKQLSHFMAIRKMNLTNVKVDLAFLGVLQTEVTQTDDTRTDDTRTEVTQTDDETERKYHPLCYTIEELKVNATLVGDASLRYLQRLRLLDSSNDVTLSFLHDQHHPMRDTLEDLTVYSKMGDEIEYLRNLRNLTINNNDRITFEFIEDDPSHPFTRTLRNLKMMYSNRVGGSILRHFHSLETIYTHADDRVKLNFLNEDHPLYQTLNDVTGPDMLKLMLKGRRRFKMFDFGSKDTNN